MNWSENLWAACALLLVFEGLLPFLAPSVWRKLFTQLAQLRDGQIRFFGLLTIVIGFVMLLWAI